jgi:hypothetical protein
MGRKVGIGALIVILSVASVGLHAGPPCCEPPQNSILQRIAPVGGWDPYGGGLLRWWNPCCFPCSAAPDDYCRKPLPELCWPAIPQKSCSPSGGSKGCLSSH